MPRNRAEPQPLEPQGAPEPLEPEPEPEPEAKQAAAETQNLFVATTSTIGAVNVRRGEIAVEGAAILRTHPHLFKPLEIAYKA